MGPLDLTAAPPRGPKERLNTVVLLARTIDKVRASLPGGNIGSYSVRGFSTQMLEMLGIPVEQFAAVVATADDDAEVVEWVRVNSTAEARAAADERFSNERIRDRLGADWYFERYPQARDMAPETPLFDVLEDDDARMFAT